MEGDKNVSFSNALSTTMAGRARRRKGQNNIKNRYQRKFNQKSKTKNSKKEMRHLFFSGPKRIKSDIFCVIINLTLYIIYNINLISNE